MTFLSKLIPAFGVAMIAGVAFGGAANAQAARTWVSGVGDDQNPCSRTAPCASLQAAYALTNSGGEINVIDPGNYGGLVIDRPVSVIAEGPTAGIVCNSNAGIRISNVFAPSGGRVVLKGLDLNGASDCFAGVSVLGAARVVVEDTIIQNYGNGVNIDGPAGARVTLNRVTILHNSVSGVSAGGENKNQLFIQNSLIDTSNIALNAGASAQVVIGNSTFSGSTGGQDVTVAPGGIVLSYGDNVIRTGSPTSRTSRK